MQDPSQGIQRELQAHVHLVSTYRFPHFQSLHPDKVAEWLMAAPKIARDQAPFYWTYLDRPGDGTILLTWQSAALGPEAPSDGYIWAGMEVAFQLEIAGGYILEMYHHKTGYGQGEPVATHARRRYRLIPSKYANAPGSVDACLWIFHYSQADPNDRVPSNVVPIDMRIQSIISTRNYLQSQGQIVQKEFMLHDRSNWPQISFPRGPPRGGPMYGANMGPARVPQTMAYPTQHPAPGPPAKRVRTQPSVSQTVAAGSGGAVLDIDDEEDTSRGDLFDHITPREISMARYKQNHEWLEEVLSSPYALHQIIPVDLGLGLRGELGSLTDGIFDAPYDPEKDVEKYNYVGRLDETKADQFRVRTQERIVHINKDMEKMKAKHAKRLAKFQKNNSIDLAEKELRTAVNNPTDSGSEYWRLEGKIESDGEGETRKPTRAPVKVDDILAQVEASLNKHAVVVHEIRRIQDGGYEEALSAPTPPRQPSPPQISPPASHNGSQNSGVLISEADMDMGGNSAAGLLDQFHTGLSSNATPGSNFATPLPHFQGASSSGTPNMHILSPQPAMQSSGTPQAHQTEQAADVNMTNTVTSGEQSGAGDAAGTGDWVVIGPGDVSSPHAGFNQAQAPTPVTGQQALPTSTTPAGTSSLTPGAAVISEHTHTNPPTHDNTPLPDFHTSPNDFGDLGDLEGAGDALANYNPDELSGGLGGEGGDLSGVNMDDLGLDLGDADIGLDDSAFGEAFHGVEARVDDGNEGGNGEGM